MTMADLQHLIPIMIVASTSVMVMLFVAFLPYHGLFNVATLVGLLLAFLSLFEMSVGDGVQITPLLIIDRFALFYTGLILLAGIFITLFSLSYYDDSGDEKAVPAGEYYVLLIIAILGGIVLVSSNHFASFFIGLELLGVSLYVLVSYLAPSSNGRDISLEAGIKYLILSGVASALLLFGIALLYAEFGTLEFVALGNSWSEFGALDNLFVAAGMGLLLAGVAFKLSLVPFHMWTPDVYEGAPAPSTAFIATVSKGAIIAVLLRFFITTGAFQHESINMALMLIAIASMLGGNLLALLQTNVKRILAYSSIAHVGYIFVALLTAISVDVSPEIVGEAVTFYLVAYFITTLGALGVVNALSQANSLRDCDQLEDYRGLFWRHPFLASVMVVMLFSLAGIPLTVGFIGKFYIFTVGVQGAMWLLLGSLILGSAIGLYYYLRLIITMFMDSDENAHPMELKVTRVNRISLAGLTAALIWLGVYPEPIISLIQATSL